MSLQILSANNTSKGLPQTDSSTLVSTQPATSTRNTVVSQSATAPALTLQGASGQSVATLIVQPSSGVPYLQIQDIGIITNYYASGLLQIGQSGVNEDNLHMQGYYLGYGGLRVRNYNGDNANSVDAAMLGRSSDATNILRANSTGVQSVAIEGLQSQTANLLVLRDYQANTLASFAISGVAQIGAITTGLTTFGIFGKTPAAQQSALTSANTTTPNTGDSATDTLIANMRTRIGELEARLSTYGFIP